MSMTDTIPSVEVPAVAPTPYPFGLFSIAPVPTPTEGNRWEGGVWWASSGCQQVGVTNGPCSVDDPVPDLDPGVLCGFGMASTFTVYARSNRSVGSGGPRLPEKFQQARDTLLAGEQFAVESALWDLLTAATSAADGTAATVAEAVAMVDGLLPTQYAGTGVLHLSRYAAGLAGAAQALRVQGANLVSFLGTPTVAGGGYLPAPTATGPAVSVIGTGRVVIIRGDVFDLGQTTIDPLSNEVSAVVERTYAVGWDCTAIRVSVSAAA